MKGAPGAATKWIPKSKTCKNSRKIHVFRKCLGGSLASTLGGHYFCLHILRPQDGPVEGIVFVEKLMLFICFGRNRAPMQRGARLARRLLDTITPWVGSTKHQKQFKNNGLGHFWGTHLGHQSGSWKCKNRSYAAWRSFFFLPERSHAAWRSFFDFWLSFWCPMLGPARASKTL